MNVALTPYYEKLIRRLIRGGRYNNASEVVRAGLRRLEESEAAPEVLPPGSLAHLYTAEANRTETQLVRASSLLVEPW